MSRLSRVILPLRAAPSVISVRRFIERRRVVLPEPDAPIRASTSPWRTGRVTSLTTQFSPYASHTASVRMRSLTWVTSGRAVRSCAAPPATAAAPLDTPAGRGAATCGSRSIAIRRTGGGISGSISPQPRHEPPQLEDPAGPALRALAAPRQPRHYRVQREHDHEQHERRRVGLFVGVALSRRRVVVDIGGQRRAGAPQRAQDRGAAYGFVLERRPEEDRDDR